MFMESLIPMVNTMISLSLSSKEREVEKHIKSLVSISKNMVEDAIFLVPC